MDEITYIPTIKTMKSKDKIETYVNFLELQELQEYVSESTEYSGSDIIQRILRKDIDMSLFIFKQEDVVKLMEIILENRNDVYPINDIEELLLIMIGIFPHEDEYEKNVIQEISNRGISVDKEDISIIMRNIKNIYEQEIHNLIIKTLILSRIKTCSDDPLQGVSILPWKGISFPSSEKCESQRKGLLYLTNEYKGFLSLKINVNGKYLTKLELIMILIYWDVRINELSKYISLELIRKKQRKWESNVSTLLKNIYEYELQIPSMIQKKKQEMIDMELETKKLQDQENEKNLAMIPYLNIEEKISFLTLELEKMKMKDPSQVETRYLSNQEKLEWDLFKKEQKKQKELMSGGSRNETMEEMIRDAIKKQLCKDHVPDSENINLHDLLCIEEKL